MAARAAASRADGASCASLVSVSVSVRVGVRARARVGVRIRGSQPVRGELLELVEHILEQVKVDAANEGGPRLIRRDHGHEGHTGLLHESLLPGKQVSR